MDGLGVESLVTMGRLRLRGGKRPCTEKISETKRHARSSAVSSARFKLGVKLGFFFGLYPRVRDSSCRRSGLAYCISAVSPRSSCEHQRGSLIT